MFIKTYSLCKELKCLPEQGALLDQDSRMLEAFDLLSSETNKFENAEVEKQKNEAKNNNSKIK